MKIGVPGEFHEDRWQRTAEDSERRVLPHTREVCGTHRIQVISWQSVPLAGLRHGYPAHRCSRGILAWRRGSSFRPLARLPCPQVPNCYPRGVYKRSADGQQRSADATSGQRKFSQRMPAAAGQLTASSFRPGEVRGDSARGRTRAARQRPGAVRQRNMADWERRRRGGKIFSLFCQATSSPESGHIPPEQKNTYL